MQNFSLISAIALSKQAPNAHASQSLQLTLTSGHMLAHLVGDGCAPWVGFFFYNTPKGIATDLWTGQFNIQNSQPGSLQLLCDHSKAGDVSGPMSYHTVKQSTSSECYRLTVHLLQTADLKLSHTLIQRALLPRQRYAGVFISSIRAVFTLVAA